VILNLNPYPVDYTWRDGPNSGSGTAPPGLSTFTSPVGGGGSSGSIDYAGGSDTDSISGTTCPLPFN